MFNDSHKNSRLKGKKICFIAGTLGQGGAEKQLYYMLRTLTEQGAKAWVCCLTRGEFWEKEILALGVPVIWVGQKDNRLFRLLRIMRSVKTLRPDILQSAHFYTNLYVTITGRLLNIKAIGAMRSDCVSEVAATGKLFGILNLKTPRLVAGNSRKGIENAKKMGVPEHRLFFLPNVIDGAPFLKAAQKTKPSNMVLLAAGRLVRQKRMDLFINLIAKFKEYSNLRVTGLIAGEGPMCESLKEQANAAGLNDEDLRFLGKVKDMAPVYAKTDIFVLTSEYEGTPNVVMEAMASGLPVVASNVGGVNELIYSTKTGFLFEKDNEEELFSNVKSLVENEMLRYSIGENGKNFIKQHHDISCLSTHLSSLYSYTGNR